MGDSLAAPLVGVALAAGAGLRLRPLTLLRPKPLCPVGDRALLDWSLDALETVTDAVAVNVHHGRNQLEEHLDRRHDTVQVSVEEPVALGTAGAIAALRPWIDGRGVLIVNSDTWHRADLAGFVTGWDGERVRVLTSTPLPFGPSSTVIASILPWAVVGTLERTPSGLWERVWRVAAATGRLDAAHQDVAVIDCGRPADYLRANLEWSGGASVIGEGAVVEGELVRSVVWPGAHVGPHERLVDAIRAGDRTVLIR